MIEKNIREDKIGIETEKQIFSFAMRKVFAFTSAKLKEITG